MSPLLRRFFRSDQAATSVEYAVMLALILMVVIGAITSVGTANGGLWGGIQQQITSVTGS